MVCWSPSYSPGISPCRQSQSWSATQQRAASPPEGYFIFIEEFKSIFCLSILLICDRNRLFPPTHDSSNFLPTNEAIVRKAICLVIVDFFSLLDVGCWPCCCPHDMFVMNKSDHKVVICYGHVNKYYNICNNCRDLTTRGSLGGGIRNVETISSVHSVLIVL